MIESIFLSQLCGCGSIRTIIDICQKYCQCPTQQCSSLHLRCQQSSLWLTLLSGGFLGWKIFKILFKCSHKTKTLRKSDGQPMCLCGLLIYTESSQKGPCIFRNFVATEINCSKGSRKSISPQHHVFIG